MSDWLTSGGARRLGANLLAALSRRLQPLVRRIWAERIAARDGIVAPDWLDAAMDEAIARLTGQPRQDRLIEKFLVRSTHRVVAAGFFRKPAVRNWLCGPDVVSDLRRVVRHRFLQPLSPPLRPRVSTLEAYEEATGEHRPSAQDAFNQAVSVILASLRTQQGPDSSVATAAIAFQGEQIREQIEDLPQRLTPSSVAAAGAATLAERAQAELKCILVRRSVVSQDETRTALQTLNDRLATGDLHGAPSETRAQVVWWAARLAASDPGPRYDELVAQARALDLTADFGLHEALRLSALGEIDEALRRLRERADPDARSNIVSIMAKAGRRADMLAWVGDLDHLTPDHFTGIGWRNLAGILMEEGRYADAVRILERCTPEHLSECPDILYVRGLARAATQYPDYAREPLRHGIVPQGAPRLEGAEADAAHDAAVRDLSEARAALDAIGLRARGRNAQVCALGLRLSRTSTRGDAVAAVAAEVAQQPLPLDLVGLALHYGISFDRAAVEARLMRAERLSPLRGVEAEARLALLRHGDAGKLAAYLETNAPVLSEALGDGRLAGLRVEALARSGDIVRARQVLDEARSRLGDDHERLLALIEDLAGSDPTEAFAAIARRTGDAIDFMNLCTALERAGNWSALIGPARDLLNLVPNTENLRRLVAALHNARAPDTDVLKAFSDHAFLTGADRQLSLAKANALLGAGRISEAVNAIRELYSLYGGAEEAVAACNAAILSGDWPALH